jgi:hypothetical protein
VDEDHDEEAVADEAAPLFRGILSYLGSPGINLDEAPLAIYVLLDIALRTIVGLGYFR